MKKKLTIIIVTTILITLILLKFLLSFIFNEIVINNYNNSNYKNDTLINLLYILNTNEKYIIYYNHGNNLYKQNDYEQAIEKYKKALTYKVPKNKVCKIRINLSLSMIKNIDINNTQPEQILSILKEARTNLYNNNCAHEEDDNGDSKKAEQLENEIKELENSSGNSGNNSDPSDPNNENNPKEKEIEEKLKEQRKKAQQQRQNELNQYENLGDYEYYQGKKW